MDWRRMDNRTGDRVTFRGEKDEYRLIGVSVETGIVQATRFGKFDDNRPIMTTDVSEIAHNYTAAARARAKAEGLDEATATSLAKGLDESAEGDVVDLGSFSYYLESYTDEDNRIYLEELKVDQVYLEALKADELAHEEFFRDLNDSDYIKGV